jgi:hypothetical protein
MISDHIEGHSSLTLVRIIPYTLRPILPESSCICITQLDSMVLSAQIFFDEINQLLPVPHICVRSWNCMLDVGSLLPFGTPQITTMKVEFGNSGTLTLAFLPARRPKSVAGRLLPCIPFFLASRTSLAHFFRIISTHCRRMHSALSKYSKGSHFSQVSKKSATTISKLRSPFRCCFRRFCPGIIDRCFFSRNPATHTFFHLLNALKLGCPILLANCFKENSVCFKLVGAFASAPPKSDKLSLSQSASN